MERGVSTGAARRAGDTFRAGGPRTGAGPKASPQDHGFAHKKQYLVQGARHVLEPRLAVVKSDGVCRRLNSRDCDDPGRALHSPPLPVAATSSHCAGIVAAAGRLLCWFWSKTIPGRTGRDTQTGRRPAGQTDSAATAGARRRTRCSRLQVGAGQSEKQRRANKARSGSHGEAQRRQWAERGWPCRPITGPPRVVRGVLCTRATRLRGYAPPGTASQTRPQQQQHRPVTLGRK